MELDKYNGHCFNIQNANFFQASDADLIYAVQRVEMFNVVAIASYE